MVFFKYILDLHGEISRNAFNRIDGLYDRAKVK